jgi:hypothetical protein
VRRRYVSSPARDVVVIVPPLSSPLEVTSLEQKPSYRVAQHRNCLCRSYLSIFTYHTYVLSSIVIPPTGGSSSLLQHKDALELLATVTQQTKTATEQQNPRASTELPRLTVQPSGVDLSHFV